MEFICSDIRNNVDCDRASLAVEIAFKITWSDSMNNLTIDFLTETPKNERHDLHPLADKKIILGGNISFFLSLVLHLGLERSDLMEKFHHLSPLVPDGFSIYSLRTDAIYSDMQIHIQISAQGTKVRVVTPLVQNWKAEVNSAWSFLWVSLNDDSQVADAAWETSWRLRGHILHGKRVGQTRTLLSKGTSLSTVTKTSRRKETMLESRLSLSPVYQKTTKYLYLEIRTVKSAATDADQFRDGLHDWWGGYCKNHGHQKESISLHEKIMYIVGARLAMPLPQIHQLRSYHWERNEFCSSAVHRSRTYTLLRSCLMAHRSHCNPRKFITP